MEAAEEEEEEEERKLLDVRVSAPGERRPDGSAEVGVAAAVGVGGGRIIPPIAPPAASA